MWRRNSSTGGGTNLSGTYTPTLTNTTNITASTPYTWQWLRVGNVVTASGRIDVDPTAGGAVLLGVSLPIASALTAAEQCAGTGAVAAVAGLSGAISGDPANDRASLSWVAVDTANQAWFCHFTYLVL